MFDLILSILQAYNQIGMLIAAGICLGLGGLLLGNSLYWRLTAIRVLGTIVGVVTRNGMYSAVYRYTSADGVIHEAKSDIGTGWIGGYETGRVVPIMIARGDPNQARGAGAVLLDIAGWSAWCRASCLPTPRSPHTRSPGSADWSRWRCWGTSASAPIMR